METTHIISFRLASQFPRNQPEHIENEITGRIHQVTKKDVLDVNFIF